MPCTVGDVVVRVARLTHLLQDQLDDVPVVALPVGADEIGLADASLVEDGEDSRGMVVRVDPVPDVLPRSIELRPDAPDHVRDLPWDELLHVLVRTVVVRAVRDGRPHAEGADPGSDEEVAARLGRGVRRRGVVRRLLGEPLRIVELEIAVDLVRGDVVEPAVVLPRGLQERVGADDVRVQERPWAVQRVVVVRFRGVVHDRVDLAEQTVHQLGVRDVALHEPHPVGGEAVQGGAVARVGESVEHRDRVVGVRDDVVDEVRADEAGTAGHEQVRHQRPLSRISSR
ncbi:hypothetical protein ABE10_03775 [Bacillus toyonensis]|nr:hypothetical protein [Bacillus toyonensis]